MIVNRICNHFTFKEPWKSAFQKSVNIFLIIINEICYSLLYLLKVTILYGLLYQQIIDSLS